MMAEHEFPGDIGSMTMGLVRAAPTSQLPADLRMVFERSGDVVSARYRGTGLADGYLIGRLQDARLSFRYVQATSGGRVDFGASEAEFISMADGRLRLVERFEWATRAGSGENVFEQL